ncbi:hypothetical protein ACFY4I_03615 [Streptomyces scabiei]|uniref:hypothetical protein n=1 Tax=Streptomyces scabiei TaxID=1930 RepID=UPI0036CF5EE8
MLIVQDAARSNVALVDLVDEHGAAPGTDSNIGGRGWIGQQPDGNSGGTSAPGLCR